MKAEDVATKGLTRTVTIPITEQIAVMGTLNWMVPDDLVGRQYITAKNKHAEKDIATTCPSSM
jgi:hypothetical protein